MKVLRVGLLSGGISSALTCIEMIRRYGKENSVIINHDITGRVEDQDIKRFKQEVADYLGMEITYVNMDGWEDKDPLDVCMEIGAFKVGNGSALCTSYMKTQPFQKWLKANYPVKRGQMREDVVFYYGFSSDEKVRITRRVGIMAAQGYMTDYPLASWHFTKRTIYDLSEIGIKPPRTYEMFRHANCKGCLKSGKQQWYIIFCTDYDYFKKAIRAEEQIGYSILKDTYLSDLECKFASMKALGIEPTEKVGFQRFWADVRKMLKESEDILPCECSVA
ncbi:MAG: hypothetical protein JEZ08_16390 [Clostridiales bacterium]|nr:hypothetical protein [Clostridiales bacterium]